MTLAHGTIRLGARGRTVRTIRPPGGATDAEVERPGLFYAHNQRGLATPYGSAAGTARVKLAY